MNTRFLLATCTLSFLFSCGAKRKSTEIESTHKPTIAVVNYPLAYFAERLAGEFATIIFDAPSDLDPAFWEPTDEQIVRMQQADLILLNGANYAQWAATASLPFESTVDTSSSFEKSFITIESAIKHTHLKEGAEHSHGGTAFTTWMDFRQAGMQATTIATAIGADFPDQKDAVMKNLAALLTDLKELHTVTAKVVSNLNHAPVIASHPSYQYWERAYRLEILSLLWDSEMELGTEAIADLKKVQEANPGVKYFIWDSEPLPAHLEKLKTMGLTCVVVSSCSNRPASGDFLSVMRANIEALAKLSPERS
jgi:zinc transport system substrate-binding protein